MTICMRELVRPRLQVLQLEEEAGLVDCRSRKRFAAVLSRVGVDLLHSKCAAHETETDSETRVRAR